MATTVGQTPSPVPEVLTDVPKQAPRRSYGPRIPTVLDRGYTNFYEKALFVKLTWRPRCVAERSSWGLRAMLLGKKGQKKGQSCEKLRP
jgi:hypothetical protein